MATTDQAGTTTARYAYDPFGKRRSAGGSNDANGSLVYDWTNTNSGTDRGFTGHEHLDNVGVIHMNGRLFDPRLGVFMQGDPFIQNPLNMQNLNRYGYCYNNPMTCTDPSGQISLFGHKILPGLFNNRNFRIFAIAAAVYFTGGLAAGAYESYAATAILEGATPFAIGGSVSATSGFIAGSVGGFTGGLLNTGTVSGAVKGAAFGGTTGLLAGAGSLGRMTGGGVNGYLQTGNLNGFVRGFVANTLPEDMGFNAYWDSAEANIGIGIIRDGVNGSIVEGNLKGFAEGALIGQSTNLLGHAVGIATSGSAPAFDNGSFYYQGDFWSGRGAITFGSVVAGPTNLLNPNNPNFCNDAKS